MALHLPKGSLKTHSGWQPVTRCEPDYLATASSKAVNCIQFYFYVNYYATDLVMFVSSQIIFHI